MCINILFLLRQILQFYKIWRNWDIYIKDIKYVIYIDIKL